MRICRRAQPSGTMAAWIVAACLASGGAAWGAAASKTNVAAKIASADHLYAARADLGNVQRGITMLREVVQSDPQSYEAWWRIAEYDCYLARHAPDKQQNAILADGIAAAKKAEALDPKRPEGHFWAGANMGLLAENRGLWGGLRLITPIRNEMQQVLKIDPSYMEDGADRILGRLYYEAPFFDGGNKLLSVRLLQLCLKRYPGDSLTMIYLADSYRATGRRHDARKMLEEVLKLHCDPINGPELAEYQAQARRDLKRYFHDAS